MRWFKHQSSSGSVRFTQLLALLQFRQFGDDLKDWLPFWGQFKHIDKDDDIAPENKFQYLVQATVVDSIAREVVESFPPTGENYAKAVDSLKARFGSESIQVLIGADIMGRLLTGKRKLLSSGLVAVETHLGWTLMRKVTQVNTERVNLAMIATSLFVKEAEIADLWRLDVLGIKDPMEKSQNKNDRHKN
ncbi:hypothetical protein AVEN_19648-1 [Araneus ventricosus]|uniref:Peptidase aspartic putative domain-containing protein n=1 Tax=Araneus ventricosus TaxID=182803 RepID=A0A4Y2C4N4_ARAVE|nr:hypothetical protein AVEN_19648-1 [Araneus ventricosus]